MSRRGAGVPGGKAAGTYLPPSPPAAPSRGHLCVYIPNLRTRHFPGCREGDPPSLLPPRRLFIDYRGKSPAAAAMQHAPAKAEGKGGKKITTGRERKETGARGSRRARPGGGAGAGPPPAQAGSRRRTPTATWPPPRGDGDGGPPFPRRH